MLCGLAFSVHLIYYSNGIVLPWVQHLFNLLLFPILASAKDYNYHRYFL